jgi:hypothetical protein
MEQINIPAKIQKLEETIKFLQEYKAFKDSYTIKVTLFKLQEELDFLRSLLKNVS